MPKIAILIDGRFFIERLKIMFPNGFTDHDDKKFDIKNPLDVIKILNGLVERNLLIANKIYQEKNHQKLLYRIFFYDAPPYLEFEHYPIAKGGINYAKSEQAKFSQELHELLKTVPNIALRMGQLRKVRGWVLKENKQKEILKKLHAGESITLADFSDSDFSPDFRQKAVDMRIGLDIASLALKKQVDEIILVTGDSDFIPAAKLARVEGVRFKIDILGQEIPKELLEHVDSITSTFRAPSSTYLPHLTW